MNYIFDIDEANKFGLDEAIFLSNLKFWVAKNIANETNYHDGYYWTYNSYEAFAKLFPFWSIDKIRRIIKSLADNKIIKCGNYNKLSYDRTKWYTIIDENTLKPLRSTIWQKPQMELANLPDGCGEFARTIPYINTDNKPFYKKEIKEKEKKFIHPSIEDIKSYIDDNSLLVDTQTFYYYYESNGWCVGRRPMKSWQSALRHWSARAKKEQEQKFDNQIKGGQYREI